MKLIIRWSGTGLILVGIGLLLWLLDGNAKADEHEQQLLQAFQAVQAHEPDLGHETKVEEAPEQVPVSLTTGKPAEIDVQGMEGILSIPAIDLEAPVLYGADAATLDQSLGAIKNMDIPGEIGGSYAIAGHQAHVFGKYFNRLHEVETGTEFTFQTRNGEQTYKVFDVKIVEPHEVDVLDPDPEIALMSLITCYPEYSNTHRLVVQAELVK